MNIKIYHNNRSFYLCSDHMNVLQALSVGDSYLLYEEIDEKKIKEVIHNVDGHEETHIIIENSDLATLQTHFFSNFGFIQAAGGVVENENEEILLIFRRQHWDLPKGKLDEGESIEQCAVREIEEETGVGDLTIQQHLLNTYHTYKQNGEWILKETFWYWLRTTQTGELTPQTEEDIEKAVWIAKEKIKDILNPTYPSIVDVIDRYKVIS
jgi:ADP-ribose pyrophosphatase YjhB (NUDIX family)